MLASFEPGGPLKLVLSYGKWPGSGVTVDDIDVLQKVRIRRHPRMTKKPTNVVDSDAVVASVDMVPACEGSKTKRFSIHNLRRDGSGEDVSGSINSNGGRGPYFSYEGEMLFVQSNLPSYKSTSFPGPIGPQIEIFCSDNDESACSVIRDVTKPFGERSLQISIPFADKLTLCITSVSLWTS